MQSIDNSLILNYCCNCDEGVVGKASFAHDALAKTLTVTDESTITLPDTFKILHVDVYDRFGNKAYGSISVAAGNVVIDVSGLNPSRGFAVAITIVTTNGIAKDGTAFKIANSQTTGEFDVEK